MRQVIAGLLLTLSISAQAGEIHLPIKGGIDGDTIKTTLDLPCPLCNASVRILGIDTPEKGSRAKCAKENELAQRASAATKQLIGPVQMMIVKDVKWDKYGGRINGTVYINGLNIGQELIAAGFARPYTGKGPKPNWCS
jgi:micrococcal nuclease